jgi:RimJ/RimL family protein N-acetyltransferase
MSLRLETPRLILRTFEERDIHPFSAYRSDPEIARYQGWETPYRLEQASEFTAGMRAKEPGEPGQWYQLAIELKSDRGMIGDCTFHLFKDGKQAEVGMTIARPYQGNGYASEAVGHMVDYLFEQLDLHRICANIDPRNAASIRVMTKLGFRHEGLFRQSMWLKGEWVDEDWYAILREEWKKRINH